jgi:polyphosphate kinase
MTLFINRELSWLNFNKRVLAETTKAETLPLDRLKFLAITASNLDEFFMVRVAYLNDSKNGQTPDDAGMSAGQQLERILAEARSFQLGQAGSLSTILAQLRDNGIFVLSAEELDDSQFAYIKEYF